MRPVTAASIIAGVYFAPSILHVTLSSHLLGRWARSLEQLAFIEVYKGSAFVFASAMLILATSWILLSYLGERNTQHTELRDRLIETERRATASLLASTVAHDARNELAIIKSNAQFLRRQYGDDELVQEVLQEQEEAVERLVRLANQLTNLSRPVQTDEAPLTDVGGATRDCVRAIARHKRIRGCDLRIEAQEGLRCHVHPGTIHQIVLNLVLNAADATEGTGIVEVRVAEADDQIVLEVHDNGPGIPEAIRPRLFETFYTTKPHGTGLGLASIRTTTEHLGGSVEIDDSPLGGACLRIRLPHCDAVPA